MANKQQYHVWVMNDRRRAFHMVTSKRFRRFDDIEIPAVWDTRTAANEWAKANLNTRYMVLKCEGDECGMGDHSKPMHC